MLKTLSKCIREYKTASILSPIFVTIEVVLECLIPFVIAQLINVIDQTSPAAIDMGKVWMYGGILIAMAVVSLATGALAGAACARASAGFAKMSGRICSITFRHFPSRTLTNSLRPHSLRV